MRSTLENLARTLGSLGAAKLAATSGLLGGKGLLALLGPVLMGPVAGAVAGAVALGVLGLASRAAGSSNEVRRAPPARALIARLHASAKRLRDEALRARQPTVEVDDVLFIRIGDLVPGQARISVEHAKDKGTQALRRGRRAGAPRGLAHDGGHAAFGLDAAAPVILIPAPVKGQPARWQAVVTDGNHETVGSILAGAETMPVRIIHDLRPGLAQWLDLDRAGDARAEALRILARGGYLYRRLRDGQQVLPESLSYASINDDTLRGVISTYIQKLRLDRPPATMPPGRPEGALAPVFFKPVEVAANYLEFVLADRIYDDPQAWASIQDALAHGESGCVGNILRAFFQRLSATGTFYPESLGLLLVRKP